MGRCTRSFMGHADTRPSSHPGNINFMVCLVAIFFLPPSLSLTEVFGTQSLHRVPVVHVAPTRHVFLLCTVMSVLAVSRSRSLWRHTATRHTCTDQHDANLIENEQCAPSREAVYMQTRKDRQVSGGNADGADNQPNSYSKRALWNECSWVGLDCRSPSGAWQTFLSHFTVPRARRGRKA